MKYETFTALQTPYFSMEVDEQEVCFYFVYSLTEKGKGAHCYYYVFFVCLFFNIWNPAAL